MNADSYLSPAKIREQCNAAISKLKSDKEATYMLEKNLSAFQEDSQIKSEAFDALKLQLEDYKTVLQAVRSANEYDIRDFQFLKMAAGVQELCGRAILCQKEIAMAEKKRNENEEEKYRKKARKATSSLQRFNYNAKVKHYEFAAEMDQRMYEECQERENQYDGIESCTSGLFAEGAAIRGVVENALNSISNSFYNGAYHPDQNASWRSELYAVYYNRMFHVSENGELTIDMAEVKRILGKDAGMITAAEYDMLAMAYLAADEKDLAVFMQYMMKDRHDYDIQLNWVQRDDFSVWMVDHEKPEQLISRVENASFEKLSLLRETRQSGDNMKVLEYESQRDVLLQRLTLLNVINGFIDFHGVYQADYPKFTITKNEAGDLTVKFLENKAVGEHGQENELQESGVTIRNTENGLSIDGKVINDVKYLFNCRFGNYSLQSYIANKAKGQAVDSTFGCMLGDGMLAGLGLDFWKQQQEAEKNKKFIEKQWEALEAGQVYSNYDCAASFVDYDIEYGEEHKIFVYEGETTADKINALNYNPEGKKELRKELAELLKQEFPPEGLTLEILLTRPEEVYSFGEGLSGKVRKMYNYIVEGKIEEMEGEGE